MEQIQPGGRPPPGPDPSPTAAAALSSIMVRIPGEPRGKGRPRFFRRGKGVGTFTPKETAVYENLVKMAGVEAMAGRPPLDYPVEVCVLAFCSIPASWPQKKRVLAVTGDLRPGTKPDLDNIVKAVTDGLNGVVYRDDALIVDGKFRKFYTGAAPHLLIRISRAAGAPQRGIA